MFFRLCSAAPSSSIFGPFLSSVADALPPPARFLPERYSAVSVFDCLSSSGVPKNTISPPRSPGPGPMSRMRSACSMICGSCLHHYEGISGIPQALHHADHAAHVARVQADRRFVQHEQRIDERGAERSVRLMRCTSPPRACATGDRA